MASEQLQKTRNAPTVTKSAINQKQSLEVVQTMLHGGLSSLSYLREFFTKEAFTQQFYQMGDRFHPYKEYAAGKLVKDRDSPDAPSTAMRVLRRGYSKRVDMLLDWLEKGVFTALKAGKLKALQIYVHPDPKRRDKVIETYTFSVQYENRDETNSESRIPAGVTLRKTKTRTPLGTVQSSNKDLHAFLRDVYALCGQLPQLPEKRFVSMEIFYQAESKKDFRPKGWEMSKSPNLTFAKSEGWEKHTVTLHNLDSFFHSSSLEVTSLVKAGFRYASGIPHGDLEPYEFPKSLTYSAVASKRSNVEHETPFPAAKRVSAAEAADDPFSETTRLFSAMEEVTTPVKARNLPSRASINRTESRMTKASTRSAVQRRSSLVTAPEHGESADVANDSLNTQSSNIAAMRSALGNMMHPEQITQGDTQLQSMVHRSPPPPAISESTLSPSRATASPSKAPPIRDGLPIGKPVLLPAKAIELHRQRKDLRQHAFSRAGALHSTAKTSKKDDKGDVVLCQCGYSAEDDDMVECTYCGTWQHLRCYGYVGHEDPRLPDDHTCYQCLLGPDDKDTSDTVYGLVMKRRSMYFASQHGLGSKKEFSEAMGLDYFIADPLYNHLRDMKYVVAARNSHKAGAKASGRPLWVASRQGTGHEIMVADLFDPLMHIGHHYQKSSHQTTKPTGPIQRLLDAQADSMPPPATPASALRRKNAMTPASGLDLRGSMTPYQTPSRARLPQKRSLGDEVIEATPPAKRVATPSSGYFRLKSVQTEYVIDANGLPSSPMGRARDH